MVTVVPEILLLLMLFVATRPTLCMNHYKHEAHSILKRMADGGEGFEGHDVARVHLDEGQGELGRRLTKRDLRSIESTPASVNGGAHAIQLDLARGSKINLSLRKSGIVGPDTVVSFHTVNGRVETNGGKEDCYSHGEVQDSSGKGWAAMSHCDGVFGFAASPEYEYFVHPVGGKRSKRALKQEQDVHVFWRQLQSNSANDTNDPFTDMEHDFLISNDSTVATELGGSDANRLESSRIVVEMAMFTDEQYWRRLHSLYPGREDDFLLTKMAGTQALYGNPNKVGYDVQIKLKLMEYWTTNPKEYKFAEKLSTNLKSFCKYTVNKFFYDVHALNTGVWNAAVNKRVIGLAYLKGACTRRRCFVAKGVDLKSFTLYAHELGHSLGMPHQANAKCPVESKSIGGFMGGGQSLNFSPCMKQTLGQFLKTSRSNCLFKESGRTTTPPEFNDLLNVFPGQARSPDDLCRVLAGPGYRYVPFGKSLGVPVCQWMVCLNENENSPEFGRAKRLYAPEGFPCRIGSMCLRNKSCMPWSEITMVLEVDALRNLTRIPQWSEWSAQFSGCSRKCGTGVRTRRRECLSPGLNLAPHCPGMAVKAKLCNTKRCRGEPASPLRLRKVRGGEVCARFLRNNIRLKLNSAKAYLSTSSDVTARDVSVNVRNAHSPFCMLKCTRDPQNAKGDLDAFYPDGTQCRDSRSWRTLRRSNIKMRCVKGRCLQFPK